MWYGFLKRLADQINPKGGLDVNIQDQTSPLFQYYLVSEQKTDITLLNNTALDDMVIAISAGHGFTAAAGEQITIFDNNRMTQQDVKGVTGTNIGLSIPISTVFNKDSAIVTRSNKNMHVDGSVSPVDYKMELRNFTIPIDLSKVIVTMQHGNNVGDDGKFGGISALDKGMYFRKVNSLIFNLGNYKENQDFKDSGGEVTYTEKAPGGTNATDVVFDLKKIFGQVIRIDPRLSDVFTGVVRDKLSTLVKLTISLIGSYTEGE